MKTKPIIVLLLALAGGIALLLGGCSLWQYVQFCNNRAGQVAHARNDAAPVERRLGAVLPPASVVSWCAFVDKFSDVYPIPNQDLMLRMCIVVSIDSEELARLAGDVDDFSPFTPPAEASALAIPPNTSYQESAKLRARLQSRLSGCTLRHVALDQTRSSLFIDMLTL